MVILHRTVSNPDLHGMSLALKNLRSSKNTRSEPCWKHLSYCQAEVTSRCFGLTDNPRFCCLFSKSQDCSGIDTYWWWWTEVSSPWARESTKLLNRKEESWFIKNFKSCLMQNSFCLHHIFLQYKSSNYL